jgi:rRNA biogenesis protein RRP5
MSILKRKGAPSGNASKKGSPSKKVKSEKPADKTPEKTTSRAPEKKAAKSTDKAPSSAPSIARIKQEEPLFPRGGGSLLTPLEHKQITIQAKQDALFEEQSGKADKKGEKDTRKKKRKASGTDFNNSDKPAHDPDAVKIEGLNYKVKKCRATADHCG